MQYISISKVMLTFMKVTACTLEIGYNKTVFDELFQPALKVGLLSVYLESVFTVQSRRFNIKTSLIVILVTGHP